MKAISKRQHQLLIAVLLEVESLLLDIEQNRAEPASQVLLQPVKMMPHLQDRQAASAELKAKRMELENSHQIYLKMLDALAFHIAVYEDLFAEIKVHYIGNRLKELKKHVQPNSKTAEKLKESISFAYGT
ncbi:hypothetical protein [Pedobacter hiemivivus]|uniref:Uncharacterized protein n=1 Tax=Pedobacter hiemivivus TaxID=2530454 RepID=A0A4R0M9B4_9SPHI|nr:hypothetical protein [Pedobacter hiemivivus]TCC82820.1 hypothetical protein EZ444_26350 [Pedobacter hiemivivus]